MIDPALNVLPEPHIYYEIREILNFSESTPPTNKNVKIVGVYGDQHLANFVENKGQRVRKIDLDMSFVEEFPVLESVIEVFGALNAGNSPKIEVAFWTHLGYNSDQIRAYLACLRTQRHYVT